ncbi:MAG: hypothetical protein QOD97_3363 [Mycobacterium sp.]|nr:hypothetical protein [Mycobacterium sp.]
MTKIAVYGASGFTGKLVVAELVRRGVHVVAVGRNEQRLREAVAAAPRNEVRVAALTDADGLRAAFAGCDAVMNCVAPFELFGEQVVEAAVSAGCHYVDTTGEQAYLKRVFDDFDDAARQAGVAVVPALADDGGPGDLITHLTADLLAREGDLESVVVADLRAPGAVSRGTARTALANSRTWADGAGLVWSDDAWVEADPNGGPNTLPPPDGAAGEVEVAPFALPGVVTVPRHVRARRIEAVMRADVTPLFAAVTEELVEQMPEGPDVDTRSNSRWLMAAYATDANGRHARGWVAGTDPYGMTAVIATEGALRLSRGGPLRGVLAASQAFDPADFLAALQPHGVAWGTAIR